MKSKYIKNICWSIFFFSLCSSCESFLTENPEGTVSAEKYFTTQEGYELIENNIKKELPISNNKLGKISLFKNFTRDGKKYKIIGWSSVFWPVSNKSIQIIEKTIKGFRKQNIPYQYIVMNEEKLTDIKIHEFTENDSNVNVFLIERKIKIKNLKEPFMW